MNAGDREIAQKGGSGSLLSDEIQLRRLGESIKLSLNTQVNAVFTLAMNIGLVLRDQEVV
jgi:hypothetical protein